MPRPRYPDPTPGYYRITSSTLNDFLDCGLRALMDRQDPQWFSTPQMVLGSAIAVVAEADNLRKMAGEPILREEEAVEIARWAWDEEREKAEPWPGTTESDWTDVKGRLDSAAAYFVEKVSPTIQDVLLAETPIVAKIPSERIEIAGTPDYITGDGVGDLKVTKTRKGESTARKTRQLTVYSLLHRARYRTLPAKVWLDNMHWTKTRGWEHTRYEETRTERDFASLIHTIREVRNADLGGIYLPASEMSWKCAPKQCRHYASCPAVGESVFELQLLSA